MRALPAPDQARCSSLRRHLAAWISARPELRLIASFAALPDEVDLAPLLTSLPGRTWIFPRVEGKRLSLHQVTDPAELRPGTLGIPEPDPAAPRIPLGRVDLFLCPALAFDPAGHRLGRGAGFYDRALESGRPDALLVGIALPERIVPEVPTLDHDIPVQWLASDDGVHRCPR